MLGRLLSHIHTQLTADDALLPWQAWCQMDVCPPHAAQALLLDGAPVAEVGAMHSLSGAVWRTSQDRFQLQIHYLTTAMQPLLTLAFKMGFMGQIKF